MDITGRTRRAEPEPLLAVLKALGAPVQAVRDVPEALRLRRAREWQRGCEPVAVCWAGEPGWVELRLPAARAGGRAALRGTREDGEQVSAEIDLSDLPTLRSETVEGTPYLAKRCPLPVDLPPGVHRLVWEVSGASHELSAISAPIEAHVPGDAASWGAFLPLYALHSKRSWGVGDLTDLRALAGWTVGLGGRTVGTLPLLATSLEEPFDPSPYAPVSRLFWNELYLDVEEVPELERCPEAREMLSSPGFRTELEALRTAPGVDYRGALALKRRVLEPLARTFFSDEEGTARRRDWRGFAQANPALEDYARFRAACEARRSSWWSWPEPARSGTLREGDYADEARRYHLYVQWLAEQQLSRFEAEAGDGRLHLDLPLGVHPDGFDVWRERGLFALSASAGAPPDTFFSEGQDWGFPPLQPERIREDGYRYWIGALRHSLRHADILRIDHVMAFHRLFWVPRGFEARDGVYVRYPAEEFYALLTLLSHRHRTLIVGEDLGTVPEEVRAEMARRRVHRTYVVQYSLEPHPKRALGDVPHDALASVNTHDMPLFAAFWRGLDIQDRVDLGWLDRRGARREEKERRRLRKALVTFLRSGGWLPKGEDDPQPVASACVAFLGQSPARIVMVNLEDLWGETQPQNVPGTGSERLNWRRKTRIPFEAFSTMPHVVAPLRRLDQLRKRGEG